MSMQTFTGSYIDVNNYHMSDFCIESMYQSLSRLPRFGGHTLTDYNVLNHTIAGCMVCEEMLMGDFELFSWYLHDMSEGVMGFDAPSPVKRECPYMKNLELGIQDTIYKGFDILMTQFTHDLDYAICHLEATLLMRRSPEESGWEPPHFYLTGTEFEKVHEYIKNPDNSRDAFFEYYERILERMTRRTR